MSEHYTDEHVLTTNGMGYFWCSCDGHRAHVLWSLNEHLVDIARAAEARGAERAWDICIGQGVQRGLVEQQYADELHRANPYRADALSAERAASEPPDPEATL